MGTRRYGLDRGQSFWSRLGRGGVELRIPPAVFRYIEHELYNQDEIRQELQRIKADIIEGSSAVNHSGGRTGPGDPTGSKVVKLVSSPSILAMERSTRAVDKALQMLNEDHRMLYELKYRQRLSWQEVCDAMPCSERTYFRLRSKLVLTVGANLGVINMADCWQE